MFRLLPATLILSTLTLSAQPAHKLRIELIGDSTQTDNAGYGRGFCANLTTDVECLNQAKGGASTRTYREQGLWDRALGLHPDYMLIQFGHNDLETKEHLDRQVPIAQYEANLVRFVDQARAAGAVPVLITPLTRRYYGPDGKIHSDLTAHAAVAAKVAGEKHVPLIDLQTQSIAYLDSMTEAKANGLGLTKKDTDGKTIPDKTHLNWQGSYTFGRMVALSLAKAVPNLSQYVRPEPAELPAEGVKAMKVFEGAPFKIVLVGDSTVATGGGWGPGFCAVVTPNVTCLDLALNGRSSKSFIDEGAWAKALAEHADYYFIQFGHNDMPGKGPKLETDPDTTFSANLRRYISDVRAQQGVPILVTSLSRRTIKDGVLVQDLKPYVAATKHVGETEHVTVVDLNAISTNILLKMTQEQADAFNAERHPDAKAESTSTAGSTSTKDKSGPDRTHLNPGAQKYFGRLVANDVIRLQTELGPNIVGEPVAAEAH
jgi:lysophospholipase L1-like esterase